MLSYVLQLAITALHLQREFVDEGWYSVMIAAQHVLMWCVCVWGGGRLELVWSDG